MKLKDEYGKEYEFNQDTWDGDISTGFYIGTLKPIDEWPKEGDVYWYIEGTGDIYSSEYGGDLDENDKFLGIYRTKEEAEMAAERIRSINPDKCIVDKVTDVGVGVVEVKFTTLSKYLKAWKDLSNPKKGKE